MVLGFGWTQNFSHASLAASPDLVKGKVCLVTGANSGLGLETSFQLARYGGRVIMGVRNEGRGRRAVETVKERLKKQANGSHPGGSVELLVETKGRSGQEKASVLDLGDVRSVWEYGQTFARVFDRLDILVCSAAVIPGSFAMAQSPAHELAYTTNHLGHFTLIASLLPLLQGTAAADPSSEVRVVIVATDVTSYISKLGLNKSKEWIMDLDQIDSPVGWTRMQAYIRSKMCNVLVTRYLAAMLPLADVEGGGKLYINCVHPGVFVSEIWFIESHAREEGAQMGLIESSVKRGATLLLSYLAVSCSNDVCKLRSLVCADLGLLAFLQMDAERSALTTLYAAISPEVAQKGYHGEL